MAPVLWTTILEEETVAALSTTALEVESTLGPYAMILVEGIQQEISSVPVRKLSPVIQLEM